MSAPHDTPAPESGCGLRCGTCPTVAACPREIPPETDDPTLLIGVVVLCAVIGVCVALYLALFCQPEL